MGTCRWLWAQVSIFTIVVYTTGVVNGQCFYPPQKLGQWWSSYNGPGVSLREYSTTSFTDSAVTYTCNEAAYVPPVEYYVSETASSEYCSTEILVQNTLFYSLNATVLPGTSPSDCARGGAWSPDVLIKFPFVIAGGGCDLRNGDFHLTYDETALGEDNCLVNGSSRGYIIDDDIIVDSCSTATPGYDNPYRGQAVCMSRINPSVFGGDPTDGDILILGGTFEGGITRFFCARYREDAANFQLHFSLRQSPDSITCEIADDATTVSPTNVHFTFRADDCEFSACENDGACIQNFGSYSCLCSPGYTGTNCETDIDECSINSCQNGGTCIDQVSNYTCLCPNDYTGFDCEVPSPCLNDTCQNGGVCLVDVSGDPYCSCNDSYSGDRCEIPPPCFTFTCLNGGMCNMDVFGAPYCECVANFTGTVCEIPPPCLIYECENGGTCVESGLTASCTCLETYIGDQCEDRECPDEFCFNNGSCYVTSSNQLECQCLSGYTGDNCEIDIDYCAWPECENGGQCVDGIDTFSCVCQPDFIGDLCQYPDPCLSNPCDEAQACVTLDRGQYTCEGPRDTTPFNWVPIAITGGVLGALLLIILLVCCLRGCSCTVSEWQEEIDDTSSVSTDCACPKPEPEIPPQPIPEPIFIPCPPVDHCYTHAVFAPDEQFPQVLVGDCAPVNHGCRVRGFVNGQPAKIAPRKSSVVIRELQEGEEIPSDCPVVVNCPPPRQPQERITIHPERRLNFQTICK